MYRRKTYIAGDWTGDADFISELYSYNNSSYFNLSFADAHDLIQARDGSLNCSIKKSLCQRMDLSKTFVLVVGEKTASVKSGNCFLCRKYYKGIGCITGQSVSNRSFIEYECEKALRDGLKIVVIYNSTSVQKWKCPEIIRYSGTHIPGYYFDIGGKKRFNYTRIKSNL